MVSKREKSKKQRALPTSHANKVPASQKIEIHLDLDGPIEISDPPQRALDHQIGKQYHKPAKKGLAAKVSQVPSVKLNAENPIRDQDPKHSYKPKNTWKAAQKCRKLLQNAFKHAEAVTNLAFRHFNVQCLWSLY